MPSKKEKSEFRRYSLVGFCATAIDYGLLNVLTHIVGIPLILSNIISTSTSSVFSYILNRNVVFKGKAHKETHTIMLYVASLAVGIFVIQTSVLFVLGDGLLEDAYSRLGVHGAANELLATNTAKIIAGFGTYVWNFFTQRKYVFESHEEAHN